MYAGGSDQINVSIFVSHLVATYDPKAPLFFNVFGCCDQQNDSMAKNPRLGSRSKGCFDVKT